MSPYAGWTARVALAAVAWLVPACTDDSVELSVDLRTDYVAGDEVATVRTELTTGGATMLSQEHPLARGTDLVAGARVAELTGLAPSSQTLRVRLLRPDGTTLATRNVRVVLRTSLAVTVIVTRNCDGVSCPGTGAPDQTECLGGRCVTPDCSPETPSACPPPQCVADGDCPGGAVACLAPTCVAGTCLLAADRARCAPSEVCSPTTGCVAAPDAGPPPPDAGAMDAGATRADAGVGSVGSPGVSMIATGFNDTCAVLPGGLGLHCWGLSDMGQGARPPPGGMDLVPVPVTGLAGVAALALGARHTCVRLEDASMVCSGDDVCGQLGDGTASAPQWQTPVLGAGATRIAAGLNHTCAVMGGSTRCWGCNESGQIGDGTLMMRATPTTVLDLTAGAVAELAAGDFFGCAVLTSGAVACWGSNTEGRLGAPLATTFSDRALIVPGVTGAIGIAAGHGHACALLSGGSLVCWGQNDAGQTSAASPDPTPPTPVDPGCVGTRVACGSHHTCVLCTSGDVRCFGSNTRGQLGNGGPTGAGAESRTPVRVGLSSPAMALAVAGQHACVLGPDLWPLCWGNNLFGQLGDGSGMSQPTPVRVASP